MIWVRLVAQRDSDQRMCASSSWCNLAFLKRITLILGYVIYTKLHIVPYFFFLPCEFLPNWPMCKLNTWHILQKILKVKPKSSITHFRLVKLQAQLTGKVSFFLIMTSFIYHYYDEWWTIDSTHSLLAFQTVRYWEEDPSIAATHTTQNTPFCHC